MVTGSDRKNERHISQGQKATEPVFRDSNIGDGAIHKSKQFN